MEHVASMAETINTYAVLDRKLNGRNQQLTG